MLNTYQGKWYHVLHTNWDSSDDVMAGLIGMGYAEEVEADKLEYYEAIEVLEDANIPLIPGPETGRPQVLVSIVEHMIGMLNKLLSAGEDGTTPAYICPDLNGLELWSDGQAQLERLLGLAVYNFISERFKG